MGFEVDENVGIESESLELKVGFLMKGNLGVKFQ